MVWTRVVASPLSVLGNFDRKAAASAYRTAQPFPWVCIDGFLKPEFALEVARSYPDWAAAQQLGKTFDGVNERRKIQITNPSVFPEPVRRLAEGLRSPEFLELLSDVSGIPNLLWDDTFNGGGMHQTAAHGRLDVHVDFNRLDNGWYRRLNILLYLNETWQEEWGGRIELWDKDVRTCCHSLAPIMNRCVLFTTSEISFHGVTPLTCPPETARRSFALYFYTKEAPSHRVAPDHTTIFRARPDEQLNRYLLMPAERIRDAAHRTAARIKYHARRAVDRLRGA